QPRLILDRIKPPDGSNQEGAGGREGLQQRARQFLCRRNDKAVDIDAVGDANHPRWIDTYVFYQPIMQIPGDRQISINEWRHPAPQKAIPAALSARIARIAAALAMNDTAHPGNPCYGRCVQRTEIVGMHQVRSKCSQRFPQPEVAAPILAGPFVQRQAWNVRVRDLFAECAESIKANHRVTVFRLGTVDHGHQHPLHAAGIQAVEHMCDQRLPVHGTLPAIVLDRRAWGSGALAAGNARAKARRCSRALSASLLATCNDNAHTEDLGTRPRSTFHACNSLVSTGDAVQRRSTQYQYHTRRGPVASASRSSRTVTSIPLAKSTCRAALARMCACAGS